MRSPFARTEKVPAEVLAAAGLDRGDRVLSHATAEDGTRLLGTRDALVIVPASLSDVVTVPWQQVETADWDRDEELLRVAEVGEFGQARPLHEFALGEPGRLIQLVRERVTASVLLQRRVSLPGTRKGLMVVARRSPRRHGEISWAYEYDAGVDPTDPVVVRAAEAAMREARAEVGAGGEPI